MNIITSLFSNEHNWIAWAIIAVGYLTRLTASDSAFPISIPSRFQPLAALVVGQLYAILTMIAAGTQWDVAVEHGLLASLASMGIYDAVAKAFFAGTWPRWLKAIALVFEKDKPPTPPLTVFIFTFFMCGCTASQGKQVVTDLTPVGACVLDDTLIKGVTDPVQVEADCVGSTLQAIVSIWDVFFGSTPDAGALPQPAIQVRANAKLLLAKGGH